MGDTQKHTDPSSISDQYRLHNGLPDYDGDGPEADGEPPELTLTDGPEGGYGGDGDAQGGGPAQEPTEGSLDTPAAADAPVAPTKDGERHPASAFPDEDPGESLPAPGTEVKKTTKKAAKK